MELQHSEACIWCSAPESVQVNFRAYISIPAPDWANTANEGISHCMDCVKVYHRGRAAFVADNSNTEEVLFPIEVKRLRHSLKEHVADLADEQKDVFDRDNDVFNYWGSSQQEACPLPVPVQEILGFPFYLQDEGVNKVFCQLMKGLHRTDQLHITAVDKPLSGLFMLLIHPDNMISNWANKSVAHLGNSAIERTDEFTHVISLMLSVVCFCLFDDRMVSVMCEEVPSACRILSSHLFPNQQLDYWQGLSCLLCWISEENLNQLGSELHSDITRIYLTSLMEEKLKTYDECNSFWPKLLGFQQLIDKLGFRIWQYLNDAPDVVFNSIFNHPSIRSEVNQLKIKFTKFEHKLANRVHETAPYTWIRAFVSSFLEYESIAEQCVTMVLDKMTNEINEDLTNQTKSSRNQPTGNQKPSIFIEHSISTLVEILESLIKCNFFCVSLPCFKRSFNVMTLYLRKFHQNQGSSQQITSWQSSPLRFIRNLLDICVKKEISLTESRLLIKDIDLVWKKDAHFTNVDHNLLNVCVQNLVKHLRSIEIEDTVEVYNDEGASTSTVSEENEDYCTCSSSCTFEPFVSIKEEILDNDFPEPSPDYMFEDSSITNNFVEDIIVISSDSEDELPEVTGLLDDKVIIKKEYVSDAELLWHHGFTRDVSVKVKKMTSDDIEHLRQAAYTIPDTEQDTEIAVKEKTLDEEDTLPYRGPYAVQNTASNTVINISSDTSADDVPGSVKDIEHLRQAAYTIPDTEQDTESAVKEEPLDKEDTLPYRLPYTVQNTASNTVINISSDTSADDVPGTAKSTLYHDNIEHVRQAAYTEQNTESAVKEEPLDKEDTVPYRRSYAAQNTASNIVITISSDSSSDDEPETSKDTLHHYTPYKYTDDIIRDIKKSSAEKLNEAQKRIKIQKDIIAKERRRKERSNVITSSDSEDENTMLSTKRSLTYSRDRIGNKVSSSLTVPTENAKSGSDFDASFQTLKHHQRAGETGSNSVPKRVSWISPKRTPKYFGHDLNDQLSDISSSDIEPQVELQITRPNVFKRNIFLDIWEKSEEVETSTVPANRSQSLINACSPVDQQVAPESQDNPPSSNRITQRENILPIESVSEPRETLSITERTKVEAGIYHQQRVPKPRHKEKHINRFSSRNASFAQDLEATNLQSKKTSNALVTQCQEFPSRSDKQVPSEAVFTRPLTTADTQETSSTSHTVATTGQYQHSKKKVNLIASRVINCDVLVAVVLSWDPLWLDRQVKPEQIARKLGMHLQKVPVEFDSIDSYINVFVPLLLLETWHYVLQEYQKIKGTKSKCVNMKYFQHWRNPDVLSGFFLKCKQQTFSKSWCPSVLDLVILSLSRPTSGEEVPSYRVFAMVTKTDVQHKKGKGQAPQPIFTLEVEVQVPALNESILVAYIQENVDIQIQAVSSMISHHRLFMCFKNLNKHVLTRDILSPRVRPVQQPITSPNPGKLITKLNVCQSEAADKIFTCMETELMIPSISLLHGPPGTGKTRTIINIIERILKKERPVDNSPLLPGQTRNIMDNRPRILVCAPSNTAVDRLVLNVVEMCLGENHEGKRLYDSRFNCGLFTIVRVGYNVHEKCMRYQLSNIVNKQIEKASKNMETEKLRKEIIGCQKALQEAELCCGNLKFSSKSSTEELKQAECKRDHLEKHLQHLKRKDFETSVRVNSKSMRELVLRHADVVFCTLNGSGSNLLDIPNTNRQHDFKYVIVDEACQCTELDTLIPLQFKGSKLLLVGDPHQLPATVLSEKATELGFQQSLFERMYKYFKTLNLPINPVHLLRTQYRMHPEICSFPSRHFYNNELETYPKVKERYESFPFKPYLVFDIIEGREMSIDRNITNEAECEMVLALLSPLIAIEKLRIGIITPYKQQKSLLEARVNKRLVSTDEDIRKKIEISTVDGFQGQEKDVIILSCVRARGSSIGFVADCNRMNVALTRAKMALYIVGHFKTLQMNEDWRKLLVDAKKRKRIHVVHTGQYEAAAELCRKDQGSHNSENRIEFESRPVKEAIGPGRKPCKEVNRQEKVSRKKMTPDEGTRDKSQDLGIEAKQHRQPFETESRDHGRVIDKDNVPNKTASNGQHNERLANLPHAGHTQEDSHMERSGEGYSSVGSEDYGMESLEEGEIREEPIPSTNRSKRSKKGKKSYKDLAAVTESLRLKYPPGPLLKVISHLPSNPNEHRKKQGRSGKQKKTPQNQKHKQSRTRKEKHKSSRSSETQKVGMQQCKGHSSSRTNEEKSGQKRKRHIHDDNLEPNQKRKPGHRKKEPPQKHTRRSSSANGEPNSRQQHRRDVNNDNQEQQNSQTDRHSPSTSTTLTPQPKEQRLHHGKKRVAHKPRQQSTEHTSSDLESTSSRPPANEIPNGCSVQSEASHSNTVHPPGSSSRSGHTRSILSSPSRPKSKSVRRIRISSALPEVHIVERYIVNQPSSE
ncbi:uncharacterized protein LOC117105022 isoform X2 [Anneissia japonica]|uniref:uncharacterized protein LOC117105022 isoform X2 n=1 Tax=Anneissia japonica TaxID=1529436 RepID=UPI00142576F0|nr:uncharacterized protein LOC117105022 isoform X2 [Anneissia japonica]